MSDQPGISHRLHSDVVNALHEQIESLRADVQARDALLREMLEAAEDEFWDRTYEARHKARTLLGLD